VSAVPSLLLRLWPAVLAGATLGAIETLLVWASRPELFLSLQEVVRFGLIATSVAVSLQLLLLCGSATLSQLLLRVSRRNFTLCASLAVGLCAAPLSSWLFWSLTQGRRVRTLSLRAWLVGAAALLTSALLMMLAAGLLRATRANAAVRSALCMLLVTGAVALLGADIWVLHRLYPAFHWALSVLAVLMIAAAVLLWPWPPPRPQRRVRWTVWAGLSLGVFGPFMLRGTLDAPNLRYVIEETAPLSGKLLWLLQRPSPVAAFVVRAAGATSARASALRGTNEPRGILEKPADPANHVSRATRPSPRLNGTGISLRGDDILLITIDALRHDRLGGYGEHAGLTPALDRFAQSAAVFERAYTQTPHTSYALGSLFTGKYLRPVLSLPGASDVHSTLPNLLRRFNYRTAAFYPPAVFYVDEQRFAHMAQDHLGFEYVKEMYAPAADRILQLRDYLDRVEPGHPVFVWVHLFEPHEPYEPLPEFARGDEPEERYDAEVAAADRAAGALIALFRARKPDATVIVSADHGEEFGEHGGRYHGTTLYDEQVRVPLVWSSPGRVPPQHIDAPVQLADITPTVLAALNIPRDPRMRGTDLGPLLSGKADARAVSRMRAFSSLDDMRMWTDGAHKLICPTYESTCRLFDLSVDPTESRDISGQARLPLRRLKRELGELVASIPEVEALAMESGDAWPEALARARLGDAAAAQELPALLADRRAGVRAEALRAIASLQVTSARDAVSELAERDRDETVRNEAVVTALTLGQRQFAQRGSELLAGALAGQPPAIDLARRAAFALLPDFKREAAEVLMGLAADSGETVRQRERALAAIGAERLPVPVADLERLFAEVNLRTATARSLGELGGKPAEQALIRALDAERYPQARAAELAALSELGSRGVPARIVRWLGTESGLPGGLAQWSSFHGRAREVPGSVLLDLRSGGALPSWVRGRWRCRKPQDGEPLGCQPTPGELRMPTKLRRGGRAVFSVWASGKSGSLRVGSKPWLLHPGRNEIALALPAPRGRAARGLSVRASDGVFVELIGLVPRTADIPAPAPEPQPGPDAADASVQL